jgi:hypothetical protein
MAVLFWIMFDPEEWLCVFWIFLVLKNGGVIWDSFWC